MFSKVVPSSVIVGNDALNTSNPLIFSLAQTPSYPPKTTIPVDGQVKSWFNVMFVICARYVVVNSVKSVFNGKFGKFFCSRNPIKSRVSEYYKFYQKFFKKGIAI